MRLFDLSSQRKDDIEFGFGPESVDFLENLDKEAIYKFIQSVEAIVGKNGWLELPVVKVKDASDLKEKKYLTLGAFNQLDPEKIKKLLTIINRNSFNFSIHNPLNFSEDVPQYAKKLEGHYVIQTSSVLLDKRDHVHLACLIPDVEPTQSLKDLTVLKLKEYKKQNIYSEECSAFKKAGLLYYAWKDSEVSYILSKAQEGKIVADIKVENVFIKNKTAIFYDNLHKIEDNIKIKKMFIAKIIFSCVENLLLLKEKGIVPTDNYARNLTITSRAEGRIFDYGNSSSKPPTFDHIIQPWIESIIHGLWENGFSYVEVRHIIPPVSNVRLQDEYINEFKETYKQFLKNKFGDFDQYDFRCSVSERPKPVETININPFAKDFYAFSNFSSQNSKQKQKEIQIHEFEKFNSVNALKLKRDETGNPVYAVRLYIYYATSTEKNEALAALYMQQVLELTKENTEGIVTEQTMMHMTDLLRDMPEHLPNIRQAFAERKNKDLEKYEIFTIALLDVDETLVGTQAIDTGETLIYEKLIQNLQENNILDVWLFTNMSVNDVVYSICDPRYLDRETLIKILQKNNIHVHGVITPADPMYARGLSAAYRDFFVPQLKRVGDQLHEDNYLTDLEFIAAQQSFETYRKESSRQEKEKGYVSIKGGMYRYFIMEKPSWVKSAMVFDDATDNLADVKKAHVEMAEKSQDIYLTTVHIDKKLKFTGDHSVVIAEHMEALRSKKGLTFRPT